MTHFVFVNKGQIPCVIILILTLIDKCKMCHFECHGLNYLHIKFSVYQNIFFFWDSTEYSFKKILDLLGSWFDFAVPVAVPPIQWKISKYSDGIKNTDLFRLH
jgi:hypothetical protein